MANFKHFSFESVTPAESEQENFAITPEDKKRFEILLGEIGRENLLSPSFEQDEDEKYRDEAAYRQLEKKIVTLRRRVYEENGKLARYILDAIWSSNFFQKNDSPNRILETQLSILYFCASPAQAGEIEKLLLADEIALDFKKGFRNKYTVLELLKRVGSAENTDGLLRFTNKLTRARLDNVDNHISWENPGRVAQEDMTYVLKTLLAIRMRTPERGGMERVQKAIDLINGTAKSRQIFTPKELQTMARYLSEHELSKEFNAYFRMPIEGVEIEEIASLRDPLENLLLDLREKIERGDYGIILGDDVSGRVPALIFYRVLQKVYDQKGFPSPKIVFFQGGMGVWQEKESQRVANLAAYLKETAFDKRKKALIVTDTIKSGGALSLPAEALKAISMNFDIATMALFEEGTSDKVEELQKKLGGTIYNGCGGVPAVYGRWSLSGVKKRSGSDVPFSEALRPSDVEARRKWELDFFDAPAHREEEKYWAFGGDPAKLLSETKTQVRKDIETLAQGLVSSVFAGRDKGDK